MNKAFLILITLHLILANRFISAQEGIKSLQELAFNKVDMDGLALQEKASFLPKNFVVPLLSKSLTRQPYLENTCIIPLISALYNFKHPLIERITAIVRVVIDPAISKTDKCTLLKTLQDQINQSVTCNKEQLLKEVKSYELALWQNLYELLQQANIINIEHFKVSPTALAIKKLLVEHGAL